MSRLRRLSYSIWQVHDRMNANGMYRPSDQTDDQDKGSGCTLSKVTVQGVRRVSQLEVCGVQNVQHVANLVWASSRWGLRYIVMGTNSKFDADIVSVYLTSNTVRNEQVKWSQLSICWYSFYAPSSQHASRWTPSSYPTPLHSHVLVALLLLATSYCFTAATPLL